MQDTQNTPCTCSAEALRLYGMSALCPPCADEWNAWLMHDAALGLAVIVDEEVAHNAAA